MTHPTIERRRKAIENLDLRAGFELAERCDPQVLAGSVAFRASCVVSPGGVVVSGRRVDDRKLEVFRQRDPLHRAIAQIDEERLPLRPVHRCKLIEESGARSDVRPVLDPVRDVDGDLVGKTEIQQVVEGPKEGDRERRAGSESRAGRQRGRHHRVEAGHFGAARAQLLGQSADSVRPGAVFRRDIAPRVADLLRLEVGVGHKMNDVIGPLAQGDLHPEVERDRQDQPVVVVGVLADEVDPAGRTTDRDGRHRRPTIRGRRAFPG